MTASSHRELPGEQGNAADVIGSGQKTVTGHADSGLGETGINPRIETGLPESESVRAESGSDPNMATAHGATARGRTTTEKTTASDALNRLTANRKQNESENDGHGHESCLTESGLDDPSLFSIRRSGNTGGSRKGAVLRNFSRLTSPSVL